MADGKRRYKSDRKDYKIPVKLSEKDMDILKVALKRTGMTASAYIRELIRTGGNIDTSYPEDRAKAIRVIAGIANNINQAVKLGNSQGKLYYHRTHPLYILHAPKYYRSAPPNDLASLPVHHIQSLPVRKY